MLLGNPVTFVLVFCFHALGIGTDKSLCAGPAAVFKSGKTDAVRNTHQNHRTNTSWISKGYYAEFYELASKILDSRFGLAVARYGDGELAIIKGWPIGKDTQAYRIDNFFVPAGPSKLGSELALSLRGFKGKDYYYCFWGCPGFDILFREVEQYPEKICSATIFCDRNWAKTRELLEEILEEESGNIVLFCNENARPDSELTFAKLVVRFPGMCVQWFEQHGEEAVAEAVKLARSTEKNTLFLFSIGPMSEVFIHRMYSANPLNRYVDFGSSMNLLLTGKANRAYMNKESPLARKKLPRWSLSENGSVPRAIGSHN